MTQAELLQALAEGKMTVAEVQKRLEAAKGGRMKRNKGGGLFFKDKAFKAYSTKKKKEYTASLNMQWEIARVLFADNEAGRLMREKIVNFVTLQGPEVVPGVECDDDDEEGELEVTATAQTTVTANQPQVETAAAVTETVKPVEQPVKKDKPKLTGLVRK